MKYVLRQHLSKTDVKADKEDGIDYRVDIDSIKLDRKFPIEEYVEENGKHVLKSFEHDGVQLSCEFEVENDEAAMILCNDLVWPELAFHLFRVEDDKETNICGGGTGSDLDVVSIVPQAVWKMEQEEDGSYFATCELFPGLRPTDNKRNGLAIDVSFAQEDALESLYKEGKLNEFVERQGWRLERKPFGDEQFYLPIKLVGDNYVWPDDEGN